MSDIFFTSDTHFGHSNICERLRKNFSSFEEMDETMITRWNDRVRPGDKVYHLGDFALCGPEYCATILKRLRGNIYLIRGNHENTAERKVCASRFVWIKDYHYRKFYGQNVVLCHYAFRVWRNSRHGSWHLYGHSHGLLPESEHSLSFDVGVDAWSFAPVSWDEVVTKMKTKNSAPRENNMIISC